MLPRVYDTVLTIKSHDVVARTNGTVNGATVDRQQTTPKDNQFGSVYFLVYTGVLTDGVHTWSLEDSDDGSTWGATTAVHGTAPVTNAASDDQKVFEFGYHGIKRFVRAVCVTSGATTGGILGASATLGSARKYSTR